jgi:hypothetical protein
MEKNDRTKPGDHNGATTVPTSFPDIATCSVRKSEIEGCYECSNRWGGLCPHILLVGRQRYCNHATKLEIYVRTSGKP